MNNKMIKGSVAGATGIVLLMGGFGTYALWSDSASLPSGSVNSGKLAIGTPGEARWVDLNPAAGVTNEWDVASDVMVPQDKVQMTQEIPIDALGKNLSASFRLVGLPVSATWANLDVQASYAGEALTRSVDSKGNTDPSDDAYVFSKDFDRAEDAVNGNEELVLTFEFKDDNSTGAAGVTTDEQQSQTVSLAGLQIQVLQYRDTTS